MAAAQPGTCALDFGKRRDALLRETGDHISKQNFLSVYGETHLAVLTPSLIKEAFRKTGIVPVDRTVFKPEIFAPSKDSSHQVITPVIPPTPVRVVAEFLFDVAPLAAIGETITPPESPTPSRRTPAAPGNDAIASRSRIAVNELRGTAAGYLFNTSPIKSSLNPPEMPLATISPQRKQTKLERELQEALKEARARSDYWKTRTTHLQSTLVLQQIYCRRLRLQLKAKESKAEKSSNRMLKNPNLGRVITEEVYYNEVKTQKEAEEAATKAKARRKTAEAQCVEALAVWKVEEAKRVKLNEERKREWEQAKGQWKADKEKAKKQGVKVKDWVLTHLEPKRSDSRYSAISKTPKPTLQQFLDEGEDGDAEWEDEEDDSDDNGSETDDV
ncbi:hypothetical protein BKA70DRAFT_1340942 [Coprinopsis sp. MPI-PUGE-AT-0042]|nr:hypothetical protein BKA70DRAFT_1340942 [Coprinopsis sp. MPI-PUGE-AT-0042]